VAVVIVATIMVLLGQIFDLVDQSSRTMSETVFVTFVHRLVIERSAVEDGLDIARKRIALVRDIEQRQAPKGPQTKNFLQSFHRLLL
jgi:hypothetical protein